MGVAVVAEVGNYTGQTGIWICEDLVFGKTPVYTRYYDGAPTANWRAMAVDPSDPVMRQFIFVQQNNGEIWRLDRNTSNTFTKVLDRDAARLIPFITSASEGQTDSEHLVWVASDPIRNHIYTAFTYNNWEAGWQERPGGCILRSTDGGDTWEYYLEGPLGIRRGIWYIDAYNGLIPMGVSTGLAFVGGYVSVTDDVVGMAVEMKKGLLSPSLGLGAPTVKFRPPRGTDDCYFYTFNSDGDLLKMHNYAASHLETQIVIAETEIADAWGDNAGVLSGLWIDPADSPNHQILVASSATSGMYVTDDEWDTHTFTPLPHSGLHNLQVDDNGIIWYMHKRSLYALENEEATSEVNMSGNLPGLGANSVYNGLYVQGDLPTGGAYLYAVETGDTWTDEGLGIALAGDRSARKAWEYPVLHTNDIDYDEQAIHHTLGDGSTQAAPGDHTHNGLASPVSIEAGEDLDAGDLVDIYDDSGALVRKADSSLNYPADGYVLDDAIAGNTVDVYLSGLNTGLSGLTPGAKIYLSTAGGVSETSPTTTNYIVQEVGIAVSATSIKFEPQLTILLA